MPSQELHRNAEPLYILQTIPCARTPLLREFDNVLRTGLETILNVQLSDLQWKEASMPVSHMTWE